MAMPPFSKDAVFGPQDIRAMSTALEDACKVLNLPDAAKSTREPPSEADHWPRSAALLRDRELTPVSRMGYRVVFQSDGRDVQTLYWNGSLAETERMARQITLKCDVDAFRIFDLTVAEVG
jgi:hypothetical protein